jgi:acyl carrier protein
MTRDEIDRTVRGALARIAPDADLPNVSPDAELRRELEIDSMDFLSFMTAIDRELHVAVPEADYRKLSTLRGCVDYLQAKLPA